jgi:ParB-like chromosome segregation protein Spo0J
MKIELIPVQNLQPYANNARTHSRNQLRQIARSIEKFGFCNPVLVDDKNGIIAGHGRVEAAKLLGLEAVPTCRLSHLSEADKRAYILAHNKLASAAGWDKELLAIELQGLIDLDIDLELTGFDMGEVDLLLEEVHEAKGPTIGPEDVVPQTSSSSAVTQRGDLWSLGDHALLCADARDQGAYERLGGPRLNLVFTDLRSTSRLTGTSAGLVESATVNLPWVPGK